MNSWAGVYRLSTWWVGEDLTGSNHFLRIVGKTGREVLICLEDWLIQWSLVTESRQAYNMRHENMRNVSAHILTHSHADHQWLYVTTQAAGVLPAKTKIWCTPITKEQINVALPVWFALQQREVGLMNWLAKSVNTLQQELNKLEHIYEDMSDKGCADVKDYLFHIESDWWPHRGRNRDRWWKEESIQKRKLRKLYEDIMWWFNAFNGAKNNEEVQTIIMEKQSRIKSQRDKLSNIQLNEMTKWTKDDLANVLKKFEAIELDKPRIISQNPYVAITFKHSWHMLGAAMVLIETGVGNILYTGDIGRLSWNRFIEWPDLAINKQIDYLLMESTYGNRIHMNSYEQWVAYLQWIVRQHKPWSTTVIPNIWSRWPETAAIIIQELVRSRSPEILNILWWTNHEFLKIAMKHWWKWFDILRKCGHKYQSGMYDENHMLPGIYMSTAWMLAGTSWEMAKSMSSDPNSQIAFTSYIPQTMPGHRLITEKILDNWDGNEPIPFAGKVHHVQWTSGHGDQSDLLWLRKKLGMPSTELVHGDWEAKRTLQEKMLKQRGNKKPVTIAEAGERKKVL
jgi:Cft2 family RNA processing exonuclease